MSANEHWMIALTFILLVGAAVLALVLPTLRSGDMVRKWADKHRYRVLECHECAGPPGGTFLFAGSFRHYQVVVEDTEGRTRSGRLRCGDLLFGLFSDNVEVTWDRYWS
jgi:hypothetical protein